MPFRLSHRPAFVISALGLLSGLGLIETCSRSAAEAPDQSIVYGIRAEFNSTHADAPRPAFQQRPELKADLPRDLPPAAFASDLEEARRAADTFAWQSFLALGWPTRADGTPDPETPIGHLGDNPTVWETWPQASQIFTSAGNRPPPWGSLATPPLPSVFPNLPPGARVMIRGSKGLAEFAPDAPHGPLVDQHGRHIRTEIRVNRPVFETILARGLYSRAIQSASGPIAFPDHGQTEFPTDAGSIRVQAAWKVLSPAEAAAGRFHSVQAYLYTPSPGGQPGPGSLEHAVVGLVGLHVARKTPSAPDWVWFTFEHVDNCPTVGEPSDRAAYNFYDKTKPDLPANVPPPPPWNPALVEPASRRPQIVRQTPIPLSTRAINVAYQAALRAINPTSVWQYYELVGAEYRSPGAQPGPARARLANTTLETYLAADPGSIPSCLECHGRAETAARVSADYSFLLRLAR